MISNDSDRYLLDRLREAMRNEDADTPLGQAVARLKQPFVLGDGKKWFCEGFVSMASALRQALAEIDPSISPDLPDFLLEPATWATLFKIPLEDFNWKGPQPSYTALEKKLDNITALILEQNQDARSQLVATLNDYVANRLGGKKPKWFKLGQWYRLPFETRPQEYHAGPLEGSRKELSEWLRPGHDDRELQRRADGGSIWVQRYSGDHWQVWFIDQTLYAYANGNRLKQQSNGTK